ncbi:chitinase [Rossellomorea vietnamensis]|uniref:chitinase n=1 Tax=Rossellomorea vietnamensis TaxID=218284 RepID=A0A5D4KFT9_9BACI|nr:glycosyl hydrolase family 18 protein [Rossellomorea vietnamensis]TYR75123.1 chitinase [Rossellomorea vietnamensis]
MNKRGILLLAAAVLTFSAGFYAGISYIKAETITIDADFHPLRSEEVESLYKKAEAKVESQSKVVMGYIQDHHNPETINYPYLSHVIFSFAHPTKNGDLLFSGAHARDNLRKTVRLAHEQDTKVLLAVGGWFHIEGGETYPYFKEAIYNNDSRTKLVNELIKVVKEEQLDGVDIDFEHPRSGQDAEHLAAFIQELNSQLKAHDKELSIAVYSKVSSVTGQENESVVFLPSMFKDVDYVNIMAYDGQWDGGYNAANLSPFPFAENIAEYWSSFFEENGLSKDKLVLGVPFYAQPEDPAKSPLSFSKVIEHGAANADKDAVTIEGMTYHYNGITTIQRKTDLALQNDFGGMMIWEAGHDAKGEHSLSRVISDVMEEHAEREKKLFWSKTDE